MDMTSGGPGGEVIAPGPPPPDSLLLEQFIRHADGDAFAALMARHGPYVLAVCRRATSHAQDAEDVFQACFLELVRRAGSIRRHASVAGWLQAVAVRLAWKARTRRARRQAREVQGAMNEAATDPEDISWREVRRLVEEQIAQLPEDLRAPLILCLFRGMTQDEAAQALAVNRRTLRDRLERGRESLRLRLTQRGVTLSVLGVLLAGGGTQAAVPAALAHGTLLGATALVNHAPLAGIVSPAVLGLTGSPSMLAGWVVLVAIAGLLFVVGGAYVAWDRATPQGVAPEPAPVAQAPPPRTLFRSFRGKQFDAAVFRLDGRAAEKYVRLEDEGLRITLPAENGPGVPVGVRFRYPVRGDFELNATLEFLSVARRPERWGAGVTLYCYMDTAEKDGFWLGKMNDHDRGPVFNTGQRVKAAPDRVTKFVKNVPVPTETGPARLRVVRRGAVFSAFAADGAAPDFVHLTDAEIDGADLRLVRLAADPVDAPNVAIDVRLIDMTLTAQEFVGHDPRDP